VKRFLTFKLILISTVLISIIPAIGKENETDTATSLHQAIINGDIDKVRSILESGVDINVRDSQKWTPLHTAVNNQKNDIVQLLLDKNADVNLINNRGEAPMHLAVKSGQKNVVELLIAKGADVNAIDARFNNPLSLAQKGGHKEIAELLIKHGAKEPRLDEDGSFNRNRPTGREESPGNLESQLQQRPGSAQEEEPEINILADPNEIKARIKTYEGLGKSIEEVASKSRIGMRHWQKITEDNRIALVRVVKKQTDDEVEFIQKIALEEKAKKTAAAAETLMTKKKERTARVLKELTAQIRDQKQGRSEERSRSRSSGRGTRGASSQNSRNSGRSGSRGPQPDDQYRAVSGGEDGQAEQLDMETENEIDQWLGADAQDYDSKLDLADVVHEQALTDYSSIRKIAEQENAGKTIATIDGLLLERQQRLDELAKYVEEEKQKQEEEQDQPGRTRAIQENTNRRGGRSGTRDRSGGTRGGRR